MDAGFHGAHCHSSPLAPWNVSDLPDGFFLAFPRLCLDLYFYRRVFNGDIMNLSQNSKNMHHSVAPRLIGYLGSLILTVVAFLIVLYPDFFYLNNHTAIWSLLGLALLQSVVQSIFFLNIFSEKGPRWNLVVLPRQLPSFSSLLSFPSGSCTI